MTHYLLNELTLILIYFSILSMYFFKVHNNYKLYRNLLSENEIWSRFSGSRTFFRHWSARQI